MGMSEWGMPLDHKVQGTRISAKGYVSLTARIQKRKVSEPQGANSPGVTAEPVWFHPPWGGTSDFTNRAQVSQMSGGVRRQQNLEMSR